MKDYFFLQYKMTNRKLSETGINPLVGYILGLGFFILISEFIFYKTEFAKYILMLAALALLIKTAEIRRIEFLKIVFGNKKYQLIRIVENLLISLPFSILLFCHLAFLESVLLLVGGAFFSFFTFKNSFNHAIPTPFYKKPYEFTVGFRNTFYLVLACYALSIVSFSVDNFNLGLVSMMLVFLITFSFYAKPEDEYFVWSHASNPSQFIWKKIKTGSLQAFFLICPIVLSLIWFYPENMLMTVLLLLIGSVFLVTIILAKYVAYPHEVNITDGILIAVCAPFPPLLIILIPMFYAKSIKNLNRLLK